MTDLQLSIISAIERTYPARNAHSMLKQSNVSVLEHHLSQKEFVEAVIFAYTRDNPYSGFNSPGGLWVATHRLLYVGFKGAIFKTQLLVDHVYTAISAVEMHKRKGGVSSVTIYSAGFGYLYGNIEKDALIDDYVALIRSKICCVQDNPTMQFLSPSGDDLVAHLERLNQLRKQGALTDKEYEEAKKKLLG